MKVITGKFYQIPDPPEDLNEYGRTVYFDTIKYLLKKRTIDKIDIPLVIEYARENMIYEECQEDLQKNGHYTILSKSKSGYIRYKYNPNWKRKNKALNATLRLSKKLKI